MNLPKATFGPFVLYKDKITKRDGLRKEVQALDGIAIRIESGAELESRVTFTRFAAMGLFALLKKKRTGGEQWLTIEGPEFIWVEEVEREKISDARQFMGAVQGAAKAT